MGSIGETRSKETGNHVKELQNIQNYWLIMLDLMMKK